MYCKFYLAVFFLIGITQTATAQSEWIAPEGKILNYRTLVWDDFLGKPDKNEDPRAGAAVRPSIYLTTDSAEEHPGGRLTFKFHVKCAFQSAAWVKENVGKLHTYFYLNHEQEHYDIALTYANKMRMELSSRDYSIKDYSKEIDDIYEKTITKYHKTQDSYDGESNHSLIKEMQELWDMRIKKCLENNTDEYYSSPKSVVQTVFNPGQIVKRIPGEPKVQFAVRCRPIYSEISDELAAKAFEFKEWTTDKAMIAFYSQKYTLEIEDAPSKECKRMLAYAFMPTGTDTYKRVLIDTFSNGEWPARIVATFFANADTDSKKELVVLAASDQKDKQGTGVSYTVKVYDNTFTKTFPGRLRKLEEVNKQLESGFEGTLNGKPSKARYKTEKEVAEALKKLGFQ